MGFCKIFLVQTLLMQASSFVTTRPLKVDFRKAATDDYLSFIANSGPFVSTAYVKPRQLGANGGDYLSSIGMGGLVAPASMPAVKPVGAGADYLSTIASYQEKSALNMPTMDYVNKELKLAQNVLFDALGNITEEFVLKTIFLLRND